MILDYQKNWIRIITEFAMKSPYANWISMLQAPCVSSQILYGTIQRKFNQKWYKNIWSLTFYRTFVYNTIHERWPIILTKVIDQVHRYRQIHVAVYREVSDTDMIESNQQLYFKYISVFLKLNIDKWQKNWFSK